MQRTFSKKRQQPIPNSTSVGCVVYQSYGYIVTLCCLEIGAKYEEKDDEGAAVWATEISFGVEKISSCAAVATSKSME